MFVCAKRAWGHGSWIAVVELKYRSPHIHVSQVILFAECLKGTGGGSLPTDTSVPIDPAFLDCCIQELHQTSLGWLIHLDLQFIGF